MRALEEKIEDHEDKRITISADLSIIPVEKDTPFDPAGMTKAQKEKETLGQRSQDLQKDVAEKAA